MCEGLNFVVLLSKEIDSFCVAVILCVCFTDDHGTVAAWLSRYFGLVCLHLSSCCIYMFVCLSSPSVVITMSFVCDLHGYWPRHLRDFALANNGPFALLCFWHMLWPRRLVLCFLSR